MKVLQKIRAFFRYRNQAAELEVSSAEIKQDRVFLHPVNDPEHVYCIKSQNVGIYINQEKDLREEDIEILDVQAMKKAREEKVPTNGDNNSQKRKYGEHVFQIEQLV